MTARSYGTWASLFVVLAAVVAAYTPAGAQAGTRTFPETGKTVKGRFLEYWTQNGGLPQQGFPISEEIRERSDTDGKTYTVQYFERAVFELHPENAAPYDVLLSLLGNFLYTEKYPKGASGQQPNTLPGSRLFPETGKRVGGVFLDYWQRNGGLAQQGLPLSDEFNERSDLDGKSYRVQYFERAVFEYHPENQPPFNVLLSQLGTFRFRAKAGQPPAATAAPSTPTARPAPQPTPTTDYGAGVRVALREWAIVPGQVEVPAGKTRFIVTNEGITAHNFRIMSSARGDIGGTPNFVREEGVKTFEIDLTPGNYQMLCTLPGHAANGQRGTLVVR